MNLGSLAILWGGGGGGGGGGGAYSEPNCIFEKTKYPPTLGWM